MDTNLVTAWMLDIPGSQRYVCYIYSYDRNEHLITFYLGDRKTSWHMHWMLIRLEKKTGQMLTHVCVVCG